MADMMGIPYKEYALNKIALLADGKIGKTAH